MIQRSLLQGQWERHGFFLMQQIRGFHISCLKIDSHFVFDYCGTLQIKWNCFKVYKTVLIVYLACVITMASWQHGLLCTGLVNFDPT